MMKTLLGKICGVYFDVSSEVTPGGKVRKLRVQWHMNRNDKTWDAESLRQNLTMK